MVVAGYREGGVATGVGGASERKLLATLKREKLVVDWRKRRQSLAQVRITIDSVFDKGLPEAYTPELYQEKTWSVFQPC